MIYNEEDRIHLVNEIKKILGPKPLFYLKFCKSEQYAREICNGKLYSNTPKYYREQEIVSGKRGQGDKFELLSIIETKKVMMVDSVTGKMVFISPTGSLRIQFKGDDIIPLVSFVGISLEDMRLVDVDENHADFIFPFSEEEYAKMIEDFGKYCVIINSKELEHNIMDYCNKIGCDFILDKVEYCEQNRLDRIQAFNNRSKERFLYKNSDLAYQREYRLALNHEIPKDHYINILKLSNSTILKSEQLKGLIYSIEYISHYNK